MKPYYQDFGITIYHGDCREIMPTLEFDSILTDPPYGMDADPDSRRFTSQQTKWWGNPDRSKVRGARKIKGDAKPFDPAHLLLDKPTILWGANHYASRLPDSAGWMLWDKRKGMEHIGRKWPLSEGEMAWTNVSGRLSIFRLRWMGVIRPPEEKRKWHPHQKPVALMAWCLSFFKAPGLVLDPYMGAGPVLVACAAAGIPCIGIEMEEEHCESAVERLKQGLIPMRK